MKYSLTRTDVNKWARNTALFAAPVVLIYLTYVQSQIADGFTTSDLLPSAFVVGSMATYLINTLIDIVRKYVSK